MKLSHIFLIIGSALLTTLTAYAAPFSRAGYESPDYKTIHSDGKFEIREYPEVVVATARMPSEGKQQNSAFMTLLGYISGENEHAQKIKMTTPVFAPTQGEGEGMSFVIPRDVARAGAPEAHDKNVEIHKRPAGTFAVYRYSGRWSAKKENAAKEKLVAWMKTNGHEGIAPAEKANYDPPYIPPPLRRNEILVRIK